MFVAGPNPVHWWGVFIFRNLKRSERPGPKSIYLLCKNFEGARVFRLFGTTFADFLHRFCLFFSAAPREPTPLLALILGAGAGWGFFEAGGPYPHRCAFAFCLRSMAGGD